MPGVEIDLSQLEEALDNLVDYIESDEPIEIAAQIAKDDIDQKTDAGLDADGNAFHEYKPATIAQRAKLGFGEQVNLKRTGTMRKLGLNKENILKPIDKDSIPIAHGQITGHNGDWGYGRNWLDVGEDSVDKMAEGVAEGLRKAL